LQLLHTTEYTTQTNSTKAVLLWGGWAEA